MSDRSFRYDAFISYSHHDKDWVRGWLLAWLERAGLTVCIDFRDFEPGAPSLTEMERAVVESRKTLPVLSPDYLASEWAEFENILSQTLDPAARRRRVIPLLFKPCQPPRRIAMLTHLDFTQASEREFQLTRLIAAVSAKPGTETPAGTESHAPATSLALDMTTSDVSSLQRQLVQLKKNLWLIEEREAAWVDPRSIPVDLMIAKRHTLERISRVEARLGELGVRQDMVTELQDMIAGLNAKLAEREHAIPLEVIVPEELSDHDAGVALMALYRLAMADGYETQLLQLWQREDFVERLRHDIGAETDLFKIGWCLFSVCDAINESVGEDADVEIARLVRFVSSLQPILQQKFEEASLQEILDFLFMPMIWSALVDPLVSVLASIDVSRHVEKVLKEEDVRSVGLYLDDFFTEEGAEAGESIIRASWEHLEHLVAKADDVEGLEILVRAVWHVGEMEARQLFMRIALEPQPSVADALIVSLQESGYWSDQDVLRGAVFILGPDATGVPEQAAKVSAQLGKLCPDDVWVATTHGRVLAQLGRRSQSERFLGHALELDPHYGPALETLSVLLIEKGQQEEALDLIERLESVEPEKAAAIRRWLDDRNDHSGKCGQAIQGTGSAIHTLA